MKLLGLDFEGTGLNPATDRITEIGAVLWCPEQHKVLEIYSVLVRHPDAPPITEEITALTGITQAMLDAHGTDPAQAFGGLYALMDKADYVVAHNGTTFDLPFLRAQEQRAGWHEDAPKTPWLDTMIHVPYPDRVKTRNLVHIAAEHGFLNPFAHRAVFDVLTMLNVLSRYDLAEVIDNATQPQVTVIAQVSFEGKDKAKARGYHWDGDKRHWYKIMPENKVAAEQAAAPFHTTTLLSTGSAPVLATPVITPAVNPA